MAEPSIAACMIVKDGAGSIERAILSVRPFVDEVCVFDTGSTDGTLELLDVLASTPGAPIRVQRGEWRDSFGWARERSFEMASSTWLLHLDADDVLERSHLLGATVARAAAAGADGIVGQYVYRVRPDGSMELAAALRIVRRAAGYRWVGRCHEELTPPAGVRPVEMIANPWGVRWVHRRSDAGEGGHLARNARLLRLEVDEPDARPAAWWHLARSIGGRESFECARRYLELTDGELTNFRLEALAVLGRRDELEVERARFSAGEEGWTPQAVSGADVCFGAERSVEVGRNDPCFCLSGRKAKACCGAGRVPWPLLVGVREGAVVDV